MVTIAGNGMGGYDFANLTVDPDTFDKIICDKNFTPTAPNILKMGYKDAKEYIQTNYDRENILYVVTGSPLYYSGGILIAKTIPREYVKIIDNTSSLGYMLTQMHISQTEVESVSLHGRERIDLNKFLTNRYTFVLCDKYTIEKIAEATRYIPADKLKITIGYKLGYQDEKIEQIDMHDFKAEDFDLSEPHVLLIERLYDLPSPISADDEFKTQRGMITKRYKRHFALQNLDLQPNQILWDIGAGSGSCAIDAYKRYRVKTVLFEIKPNRAEFIRSNLSSHFVCDTKLYEGDAAKLWHKEGSRPDRIFIGGGGLEIAKKLPELYDLLNDSGILLISAVTLRNLTEMIDALDKAQIEYEVISFSLSTYKGDLKLTEPQRQLFQIKVIK